MRRSPGEVVKREEGAADGIAEFAPDLHLQAATSYSLCVALECGYGEHPSLRYKGVRVPPPDFSDMSELPQSMLQIYLRLVPCITNVSAAGVPKPHHPPMMPECLSSHLSAAGMSEPYYYVAGMCQSFGLDLHLQWCMASQAAHGITSHSLSG